MHLHELVLENFRLYQRAKIELVPRVNRIIGPNAHGKTTLLEAIAVLIAARSFRTSKFEELIRFGEKEFSIRVVFSKYGVKQTLSLYFDGKKKHFSHNGTRLSSERELIGKLLGVIQTPDHLALIKGGPEQRRPFLDLMIAQTDPYYVHSLGRYARALKERNAMLATKKMAGIEVFEEEMAKAAAWIVRMRRQAAVELELQANPYFKRLFGEERKMGIAYRSVGSLESVEDFRAQFQKMRPREMKFGFSLIGPQRDDLVIEIDGMPARYFASEGQKGALLSSLFLAKRSVIEEMAGQAPLLLIDDVGMGLDPTRRERLFEILEELEQVVVTMAG